MHIVQKECSTTVKVCAVFDASAKTSTGVLLNDRLLVGPIMHSTLLDILPRFRMHEVSHRCQTNLPCCVADQVSSRSSLLHVAGMYDCTHLRLQDD